MAAEQFAQYAPQVHASHSPLPPQQLSPRMGVAPQQQAQQQLQQQQTPSHALAPQHHQYHYTNTPATQQQTMPPPNIQQQQQQQHNTAHIVPSNQTLGMNSHSYQTNNSRPGPAQHQQHPYASTHQQQQQQQFIQHEQQQQQQQYQHYQQPQMMRQPQNLQQQQSQTHGLKQSSHLYPSSSSSTPTTAGLQGTSQYQQPNNSYNQLRSAILQSSHHPTGALIPNDSSMPALSTATPYNNTYDQYDNNTATSTTTTSNNYPNNSQRATSQQHQQLYQQQQQQHQAHHNNNHLNSGSNNNNGGLVVPPPLAYQAPKSSSAATTPSYGGGGSNASSAQQQLFPNNAYTNSYQSSQATTQGGGIIGGTLNGGGQPQTNHHQHLHHHHNSNGGSAINGSIGKIADYDPLSDGPRPLPNTARSSTTLIYSSDNRANGKSLYHASTLFLSISQSYTSNITSIKLLYYCIVRFEGKHFLIIFPFVELDCPIDFPSNSAMLIFLCLESFSCFASVLNLCLMSS